MTNKKIWYFIKHSERHYGCCKGLDYYYNKDCRVLCFLWLQNIKVSYSNDSAHCDVMIFIGCYLH